MGVTRRVWAFVGLTLLFSAPFWFLAWRFPGSPALLAVSIVPGVVALVVVLWTSRTAGELGWLLDRPLALLWAILLPFVYCLVAYGIAWATGLAGFSGAGLVRIIVVALVLFVLNFPLALGEELGWRGYLMPALRRTRGFSITVLTTSLVWFVWTVPSVVLGSFVVGGPPVWYALVWTAVFVLANTVMLGWLRFDSDSIWPPAVMRTASVILPALVFGAVTTGSKATWVLGGAGPAVAIAALVMALLLWRRGSKAAEVWLEAQPEPEEETDDEAAKVAAAGATETRPQESKAAVRAEPEPKPAEPAEAPSAGAAIPSAPAREIVPQPDIQPADMRSGQEPGTAATSADEATSVETVAPDPGEG